MSRRRCAARRVSWRTPRRGLHPPARRLPTVTTAGGGDRARAGLSCQPRGWCVTIPNIAGPLHPGGGTWPHPRTVAGSVSHTVTVASGDQELRTSLKRISTRPPVDDGEDRGEFHAEKLGGRAEAWLGRERCPTLWPARYFVRFGPPVEFIGPTGDVLGQEGDVLTWAGGIRGTVVWLQAGPGQPAAD